MRKVTCHNVEALLFDYSDGAVEEPERSAIAVHLAICDECRASADLVSGVRIAVREAQLKPAPRKRTAVSIEVDRFASARRRLRVAAACAAAAAACIAAVAFGLWHGTAEGVPPAMTTRAVAAPDVLSEEGAVPLAPAIDRAGHVAFEVAAGTALRCDDTAMVDIASSDARGVRFSLSAGRAVAEVGAVEPGFRFVVATPSAEIEARGTVFSVEVVNRDETAVRVASGNVEVRGVGGGAPVVVSAGEELWAGDPEPHAAAVDGVTHDLAVALELGTADDERLLVAAGPDGRAPGDPRAATPAEVVSASDALVAAIAGARDRLSTLRGGSSPAHLLELAQAYRRASLFDDAARAYERLVAEHPESEIGLGGLVALAQLESLILGRSETARSHYAAYLRAAPRGPLASVARQGLAKLNAE